MTVAVNEDARLLHWQVEQFLFAEAALIQERRFGEWLELTTDDILYAMPVRITRMLRDISQQFMPLERGGHFNDNKHTLSVRVKKLGDPKSWSENPPSVPRLFITNLQVRKTETDGEISAISNFMFTRTRLGHSYAPITGQREDMLRRADNAFGFMIARRMLWIDHAAFPGSGINTLL